MSENQGPILYVIVVGFHHKKGCQVEYSFPPLVPDSPNECPPGWKYLPTLALPDGSHNYDEDTVFFHLPSLTQPRRTVYGISCYRQIPVERLKNRTADITRSTVQKSVCVLSTIPLFGHIQVKMSLITHAYFDEGDFSKVSLLEDTFHHLNSVLLHNDLSTQTYVGLSLRDFVMNWKHKAVLLFKLLLLERKIIFHKSPVHPLCSTILSLLSLYPGMIESGLEKSACVRLSRPMSPMPNFSDDDITPECSPRHIPSATKSDTIETVVDNSHVVPNSLRIDNKSPDVDNKKQTLLINGNDNKENKCENSTKKSEARLSCSELKNSEECSEIGIEITESSDCSLNEKVEDGEVRRDSSSEALQEAASICNSLMYLAQLKNETCGFPLKLFYQGYLCLPYLSLPYLDLLSDVNVRGYVVGATNVLFKQKRQLFDILVDIDAGRIECQDNDLRKQLHLTTEDLRFADYIVKHVSEEKHDVFLDGVGWEGGDEWIRMQFKIYILCLLRTSLLQDGSKEFDHFNSSFLSAWKDTYNYKMWSGIDCPGILEVNPGHPFSGQLSVSDMKLRLSHTMQNTESGRKINQAMASTGRAVATTSKAVGGAFSQAKGAFSNWWSNLLVSPDPSQKTVDNSNENHKTSIDRSDSKDSPSPEINQDVDNQEKDNIPNGFIINERNDKDPNTVKNQNNCVDQNPRQINKKKIIKF